MHAAAEYLRAADEIAARPVRERDFPAVGRNIIAPHNPFAEHKNTIMRFTLAKQMTAHGKFERAPNGCYPMQFAFRQRGKNIGGARKIRVGFIQQNRLHRCCGTPCTRGFFASSINH